MTVDFHSLRRGDRLPPTLLSVGAAEVRAYLAATGEPEERWTAIAPPLALGAWAIAALLAEMPLPQGAVHSAQEFEFLAPVPIGSVVSVTLQVVQQSVRQGTNIVVFEAELGAGATALRGRATVAAPLPVALEAAAR